MATDETTTEHPERHITIAFDGGCIGNPGPGGYGAILVNDCTGSEMTVKGREADTTNNRMELRAAIEGLNALRPGAYVHMLGDSQYVTKGFTEWLPNWKARGWTASGGKPVANVESWRALEVAVERHRTVTWEWVRGHNGHELNERADKLANKEATQAQVIHRVSP
jgi:ribonuclease HI